MIGMTRQRVCVLHRNWPWGLCCPGEAFRHHYQCEQVSMRLSIWLKTYTNKLVSLKVTGVESWATSVAKNIDKNGPLGEPSANNARVSAQCVFRSLLKPIQKNGDLSEPSATDARLSKSLFVFQSLPKHIQNLSWNCIWNVFLGGAATIK